MNLYFLGGRGLCWAPTGCVVLLPTLFLLPGHPAARVSQHHRRIIQRRPSPGCGGVRKSGSSLKRKKLTPDGDPGVQIFCPQILMRHIQSSQSRAPQKKKMIVEQSRNHPNLFIITSASLPTNISTIFKGSFKKSWVQACFVRVFLFT